MFRTDVPTAAGTLPTPSAPGTPGYFTNGNPALGIPATIVDQDWLNRIQEEITSVLTQAGVTPIKSNFAQLVAAIRACNILNDVGVVNVLTANPSPPYSSFLIGTQAVLIPAFTNTSTATLNVSSLGALAVLRPDGTVAQPGDLPAGRRLPIIYDGAAWRLVNWPTRVRLAQNLTLYCNAQTGNDNNNGLTAGTAFQTLNGVYNYIYQNIDTTGFVVTVQCSGNFTNSLIASNVIVGMTVPFGLVFNFANGSTVSVTNDSALQAFNPGVGFVVTGGVTLSATGSGTNQGSAIVAANDAQVNFAGVTFGTCAAYHVSLGGYGIAAATGNYTIAGNAQNHVNNFGGRFGWGNVNVTLTGTPAFSTAFISGLNSGSETILTSTMTFTGSASAGTVKYNLALNATINTQGFGPTNIPGGVTSAPTTGGQIV